ITKIFEKKASIWTTAEEIGSTIRINNGTDHRIEDKVWYTINKVCKPQLVEEITHGAITFHLRSPRRSKHITREQEQLSVALDSQWKSVADDKMRETPATSVVRRVIGPTDAHSVRTDLLPVNPVRVEVILLGILPREEVEEEVEVAANDNL